MGDCFVLIEPCVLDALCIVRVSDRVSRLSADEVLHLSLPGRAERVTKGHLGPSVAQLRMASSLASSGVGVWADMDQLVAGEPVLAALRDSCAQALVMARASNTTATYKGPVAKWQEFAAARGCVAAFPVVEAVFLLFVAAELDRAKDKGLKSGVVLNCVYGVDLVCSMLYVPGPSSLSSVQLMVTSARLQLARPVVKKKTATKSVVARLCDSLLPGSDPARWDWTKLRTALFATLGFVLTGRWAELNDLTPADLHDYGGHCTAFIEVRKCDQFREGSIVPFVDSGEVKGSCNLLRVFLSLMPEDSQHLPLFRRIDRGGVRGQYFRKEGIGHSRMSELVKDALIGIGEDPH